MFSISKWFLQLLSFFSPSVMQMGYYPNGVPYFSMPTQTEWMNNSNLTAQPPSQNPQASASNGMFSDPFSTAMSGGQSGTLQPYVNRMTQNASNALYGGLLGYKPQSLIAGDAGGTPQNSTVPQFNMPSSLGQGLNFTGFGNRSWMKGGQ